MGALLGIFTTYLIYPLIGILLVGLGVLIGKKNDLLRKKRLITYSLVSFIIISIPALLGFLDYAFMPYAYLGLACVYLLLGWYNNKLLPWAFEDEDLKYRFKINFTIFQTLLGMLFFSLIFNLCNELKYGIFASTAILPLILLSLLIRTYNVFIQVPSLLYKIWIYEPDSSHLSIDDIDHRSLKVVTVELFKKESDLIPVRVNAKAPDDILFGEWIKIVLEDYNKKTSHSPIELSDDEKTGWSFYLKPFMLAPRRHIDHEATVRENKIGEKHLIVAKRVKNYIMTD